ncbi:hypothetical protein [Natronolimnohabitans innermongolicus]|uniref:Uncharacterized protein n=1 Tax=Natronolimnohabitans innermongolicus JCM 12255 TaxID=1227499 RepID=L9WX28_9EURY|nr:hypothetical protein [Natronolimnohabitans innermongolicus]ELY53995.1 hypothetical protein C493_13133 [Natronolimnohabitans innermongolicus JCM 12255]
MPSDNGPNWERIARQEMSINIQSFFTEEVDPHAHRISDGIEHGEDVEEEFWLMVSRSDEYIEHVSDDLERIGVLDRQSPKVRLFNLVRFIHSSFLTLGRAIEDDNVGNGPGCSDFEHTRHVLADAEDLLDELEEEYKSQGVTDAIQ